MGNKRFDQLKDVISSNSCKLNGLHWPVFKQADDTIQTLPHLYKGSVPQTLMKLKIYACWKWTHTPPDIQIILISSMFQAIR